MEGTLLGIDGRKLKVEVNMTSPDRKVVYTEAQGLFINISGRALTYEFLRPLFNGEVPKETLINEVLPKLLPERSSPSKL